MESQNLLFSKVSLNHFNEHFAALTIIFEAFSKTTLLFKLNTRNRYFRSRCHSGCHQHSIKQQLDPVFVIIVLLQCLLGLHSSGLNNPSPQSVQTETEPGECASRSETRPRPLKKWSGDQDQPPGVQE